MAVVAPEGQVFCGPSDGRAVSLYAAGRTVEGGWTAARNCKPGCVSCALRNDQSFAKRTSGRLSVSLTQVLYPGLPAHPGHQIAARQMSGGFGGMLSIRLVGGAEHATAVLQAVRVFKRATSLGGVESLIEHRAATEGPSSPVPADLLRLSIGIEAVGDLIADLDAALREAAP